MIQVVLEIVLFVTLVVNHYRLRDLENWKRGIFERIQQDREKHDG